MAVTDYRTRDGLADYGFSIEFRSDVGWRVYIIFDPFHVGNDDSIDLPYQSIDTAGRRYVDCSSRLHSLGDAKTIAGLWAELVQRYQRAQEQRALYVELIERHLLTRGQRHATRADSDPGGDAVGTGGAADGGHQDRGSVLPRPRTSTRS